MDETMNKIVMKKILGKFLKSFVIITILNIRIQ